MRSVNSDELSEKDKSDLIKALANLSGPIEGSNCRFRVDLKPVLEKHTFKILGIPLAKQSFRVGVQNGHAVKYQDKKVTSYEGDLKWQIKKQLPKNFILIEEPIIVEELCFIFPPLKTFTKKTKEKVNNGGIVFKSTKPDLTDNLSKALFDAMQGLVYLNDSQVVMMKNVRKIYGNEPGITLTISVLSKN